MEQEGDENEDVDDDGLINLVLLVAVVVAIVHRQRAVPVVQQYSIMTGNLYFREVLATNNVHRFSNVARMDIATFNYLLGYLREAGDLKNSMYICAGEKLMILIYVLRGHTNRETMERWQHSGSTISSIVDETVSCLLRCRGGIYRPPRDGDPIPVQIANHRQFSPYFDNCIGALDGTHVPAVIPTEFQYPFRNRKKIITQNVLGIVNFDTTFSYALFGWEGSAHDSVTISV